MSARASRCGRVSGAGSGVERLPRRGDQGEGGAGQSRITGLRRLAAEHAKGERPDVEAAGRVGRRHGDGDFFARLDATGIDYVVALTADHGGHDLPERNRQNAWPAAERVDKALLDALPNLEVIVNNSAGVDAVDLAEAQRRGIGVSNTPDVLTDSTADTALGLILMTLRRFGAAERYLRAGRWAADGDFPYGRDVSGLQVGILGLGRIGSAIAARLSGFDCAIAYHNRHEVAGSPYRYAASARELAESVDLLVVATAGGRGTDGLVDREVMKALGPQGYFINIARGSVVDQTALIELLAGGGLRHGQVIGASDDKGQGPLNDAIAPDERPEDAR